MIKPVMNIPSWVGSKLTRLEPDKLPANVLKAAREILGLTQSQLAKKLNFDRSAISYFESGKREIPKDRVQECKKIIRELAADKLKKSLQLEDMLQ